MTPDQIQTIAAELLQAEADRRTTDVISARFPDMTMDDAYAIQSAQMAQKRAQGRRIIGWKIGLTSKAMQKAYGIETPDSGVIYDDMLFQTGDTISQDRFIEPLIEAEIAFVMKAPIDGDVTREQVLAATDYVAPVLEVLDWRVGPGQPGQSRTVLDTISDNAANAGIVMGDSRHAPDAFDLRWVGAIVKRDGQVETTGLGAAVLDDPVTSLMWLARRMSHYGQRIEAGQIILTGSFIAPITCPRGCTVQADYGAFGAVRVSF